MELQRQRARRFRCRQQDIALEGEPQGRVGEEWPVGGVDIIQGPLIVDLRHTYYDYVLEFPPNRKLNLLVKSVYFKLVHVQEQSDSVSNRMRHQNSDYFILVIVNLSRT